ERFAPTTPPEVVVAHPVSAASQRLIDIVVRIREVDMIIPIDEIFYFPYPGNLSRQAGTNLTLRLPGGMCRA
ncbi:MAG: hypothetical protein ABI271_05020, partial [Nitrosospira sp.]